MKGRPTIRGLQRTLWTALLAAGILLTSGCATFMSRDAEAREFFHVNGAFPATRVDCMLTAMGGVYMILDLPFSLATDTLLLPYDLATKR